MGQFKKYARNLLAAALGGLVLFAASGTGIANGRHSGEAAFKTYCSACHYEGGNLLNPGKTLSKSDREKNGVKTSRDIIHLMRNPGMGMTVFDEDTLSEKEAQEIAEYILATFK